MIAKCLIAILLIMPLAFAATTAGQSQNWDAYSFTSTFKIAGVNTKQLITVDLQYGDPASTGYGIIAELYSSTNTLTGTQTCPTVSTSCRVTFLDTATPSAGTYSLKILYPSTMNLIKSDDSGAFDDTIRIGKLTVSGDNPARGVNKDILKTTFVPGNYRYHRIYINPLTPTYTVTLGHAAGATQAAYIDAMNFNKFVKLVKQKDNQTAAQFASLITASTPFLTATRGASNPSTTTQVTFSNVAVGYYWLIIDAFLENPSRAATITDFANTWTFSISYLTENYICPYDKNYPDTTGVYRGCFFPSEASKLPCINFDATTQVCKQCFTGYALVNNVCLESECPAGKYKKFGQCLDNPFGCQIFNDFTKCVKCLETYTLKDGACIRVPLICPNRFFYDLKAYVCAPVSQKCKDYSDNGDCTKCQQSSEKVVAGKCVSAVKDCTITQYVLNGVCINIDPTCGVFQKIGGKCISCSFGFKLDEKDKCVKIVCPERFVPNEWGFCVRVSELCVEFDIKGFCSVCIPGYLAIGGVCKQMESPVNCAARQYLGFDNVNCYMINELCEVFNYEKRECSKCLNGFYLMYTGQCVRAAECKTRQVQINNVCTDVSPTCGNFDRRTGKCLNCANPAFQLYFGLCIDKSKIIKDDTSSGNQNSQTNPSKDPGCRVFQEGVGCLDCIEGYRIIEDSFGFNQCKKI